MQTTVPAEPPQTRSRRRLLAALAALAAVLAAGLTAWAAWSVNGSGDASAAALRVPAGATPTATSSGDDVSVSWPQTTLGDRPVAGYEVRRYPAGGGEAQTVGAGCAGLVASTSCTEHAVPAGDWRYTVTPRQAAWGGPESARSGSVTVQPPPPPVPAAVSVSPSRGPAGTAATASGTGFKPGEAVTIDFDGAKVGTGASAADGSVSVGFGTPGDATTGDHAVTATGADSGRRASTTFTVTPLSVSASPSSGEAGKTSIHITGSGWPASTTGIRVELAGTAVCSVSSSASGGLDDSCTTPKMPAGSYTLRASVPSSAIAASDPTRFEVTPTMTLNPTSGSPGDRVGVSGEGFAAGSPLTVKFDGTALTTSPSDPRTGVAGGFSGVSFTVPDPAAGKDVGYRGDPYTATSVEAPSGQKPQSKTWFTNDGVWWGSLFDQASGNYTIHRLDPTTHRWIDTGTVIDGRNSSEADTLWDGSHLYVASGSDRLQGIKLLRYTYDPAARRFSLDSGYPVDIGSNAGPTEAVVLDRDSSGKLWITYANEGTVPGTNTSVEDGKVYVAHSTDTTGASWVAPYALPVAGASNITADDISALVSYNGKIGVMWSNQNDNAMYFATHSDGAPDTEWSRDIALSGPRSADDHINLKSLEADPGGRVFAAVKTSLGDDPSNGTGADQVLLLDLHLDGTWSKHGFGTVGDDHTRPIVLTNQRTRRLYMFATAPTCAPSPPPTAPSCHDNQPSTAHQTIYYKETSLDHPSFSPGLGTPFIKSENGYDINNPTSTKQDLSTAPSLVVLASDFTNYWHNELDMGSGLSAGDHTVTVTDGQGHSRSATFHVN